MSAAMVLVKIIAPHWKFVYSGFSACPSRMRPILENAKNSDTPKLATPNSR